MSPVGDYKNIVLYIYSYHKKYNYYK